MMCTVCILKLSVNIIAPNITLVVTWILFGGIYYIFTSISLLDGNVQITMYVFMAI